MLPALALVIGGCGQGSSSSRPLSISELPLVKGAQVATEVRKCDSGSNAFCAVEAVIVDHKLTSSGALVTGENRWLHSLGWTSAAGDNGVEQAQDSPGSKLRVTYATGLGDLTGIDLHWITRPWPIEWSLSSSIFARTPAMSILLETGPA